jgi:ribosomal-protein-alanine N-acetyltransferase
MMPETTNVMTPRMRLVPGTQPLAEAELEDGARLAKLLGAEVPESWPPESLRPALPMFLASCKRRGTFGPWCLGWYGVLHADGRAVLCGSVGFKGGPTSTGMVEIGYSVLPLFQKRGIATEMVVGASRWALAQPGVSAVEADILHGNLASLRVVAKAGFRAHGPGAEPDTLRFRLERGSLPLAAVSP